MKKSLVLAGLLTTMFIGSQAFAACPCSSHLYSYQAVSPCPCQKIIQPCCPAVTPCPCPVASPCATGFASPCAAPCPCPMADPCPCPAAPCPTNCDCCD